MACLFFLLFITLLNAVCSADPLVVLKHGGQLRGKSFDYNGLNIDLFLGVPFAAPPTGDLRFEKPRPAQAWTGVRDAIAPGHFCPQKAFTPGKWSNRINGNEDCLYLDITIPAGVSTTTKKPVMVWIHGGGYAVGSKDAYPGATIAKHGDVIVVAINYRLEVLGFLSNGPGTGNYGLWDQREALVWLKDNIAAFGGDPDMITIFGESAGAGSVAALTLSQHTNGLFKRAIQESGSMFTYWGWFTSERQRHELVEGIKRKANCTVEESVYDCLKEMTAEKVFAVVPHGVISFPYHPEPDNDFFPAEIVNEDYTPSQSYDLLSGVCKQESAGSIIFPKYLNQTQESVEDGLSLDFVKLSLRNHCSKTTPKTVDMCIDFFIQQYRLNSTDDNKERGIRLSFAIGAIWFNADVVRQLRVHSEGSRSTYAYQFSENYQYLPPNQTPLPWAKISASHTDDLPFVFGSIYNKENNVTREYTGGKKIGASSGMDGLMNGVTSADRNLTDVMLTAWTNFAKSGNPNKPQSLPADIPQWPEFDKDNNQFMELNSTDTRVITTPNKDILDNIISTIFPARTAQIKADVVKGKSSGRDAVVG